MNTKNNINPCDDRSSQKGIVYKKTGDSYILLSNGQFIPCKLASSMQKNFDYSAKGKVRSVHLLHHDPVAVGDEVRFVSKSGDVGQIVEVLPRHNWISRRTSVPMPGALPDEQVIAANIDLVMPVFAAASPTPKWNLLDRYLVSAEAAGIPALVCITKLDLVEKEGVIDPGLLAIAEEYRRIGYPIILTSVIRSFGLAELKEILPDKTTVLLGKSGVGKTSLLNALEPGLGQRVSEISSFTGKGRHTTSVSELFPLADGGALMDTPGIREFGLWDVSDQDLAGYFPEMRPFVGQCKFGLNCSHDEEPGCAIRKAVMAELISPRRYASYLHLREDI
jgi:ribosome biogenesis GTPase / thiamine phosphate phosphatase